MKLLLAAALVAWLVPAAQARLLLSQKEALALAFPAGVQVEKKTAFLDDAQVRAAQTLAKVKLESQVWTYYVAMSSSRAVGFAYFDRVVVRTMPAVLMAALDAEGRLRFLEVLSFEEPEDYLPRRAWLALFAGRALDDDLRLGGILRNVTGATLSSHAFSSAARRMLAVHQLLHK